MRISGPRAGAALAALAGALPPPRRAAFRRLSDPADGAPIDDALVLWLPGPASATGEDQAELHVHGGRAVVAATLAALARIEGCRVAEAGEFTRRAFENGALDLAQAEGLADLLAAETESQRQSALLLAGGALGRMAEGWRRDLLALAARTEAALDFSDEDDVGEGDFAAIEADIATLAETLAAMLDAPRVERLRDGVRVVLAGPPNAGKSSLINALAGRDVAIVTPQPGTTRDRIEVPLAIDGVPLVLTDTAGLRDASDAIEAIGVALSAAALADADLIVWLGAPEAVPDEARTILVGAKCDLDAEAPGLRVSSVTGEGLAVLKAEIASRARALLPRPGVLALNARHRAILAVMREELLAAIQAGDGLIIAEHLRHARVSLDRLTGRAGVEDMLDALFGTFCIGK